MSDVQVQAVAEGYDPVTRPAHYLAHPSGEQCITFAEWLGFNVGNAFKYVWRQGLKNNSAEDLGKALWYLDRAVAHPASMPHRHKYRLPDALHTAWARVMVAADPDDVLASALDLMWASQFFAPAHLPIARRLVATQVEAPA
jgi:hypothetical protein